MKPMPAMTKIGRMSSVKIDRKMFMVGTIPPAS
jgi:hypothetical protein